MFLSKDIKSLWHIIMSFCFLGIAHSLTLGPTARFSMGLYPFGGPGAGYPGFGGGGGHRYPAGGHYYPPAGVGGCPVCDSSVFSYCSHRLLHDSCCCGDGYYTGNSFECEYADCNYIHANSCRESRLIADCCCDDPYRSVNPLFPNYFKK